MNVLCGACQTRFRVPDDRIAPDKVVKVKCPKCGGLSSVRLGPDKLGIQVDAPVPAEAPAAGRPPLPAPSLPVPSQPHDPFAAFGPAGASAHVEVTRPNAFPAGVAASRRPPEVTRPQPDLSARLAAGSALPPGAELAKTALPGSSLGPARLERGAPLPGIASTEVVSDPFASLDLPPVPKPAAALGSTRPPAPPARAAAPVDPFASLELPPVPAPAAAPPARPPAALSADPFGSLELPPVPPPARAPGPPPAAAPADPFAALSSTRPPPMPKPSASLGNTRPPAPPPEAVSDIDPFAQLDSSVSLPALAEQRPAPPRRADGAPPPESFDLELPDVGAAPAAPSAPPGLTRGGSASGVDDFFNESAAGSPALDLDRPSHSGPNDRSMFDMSAAAPAAPSARALPAAGFKTGELPLELATNSVQTRLPEAPRPKPVQRPSSMDEPRTAGERWRSRATTFALVGGITWLALGVTATLRHAGRVDASWASPGALLLAAFGQDDSDPRPTLTAIESGFYEVSEGKRLFFVRGRVMNRSRNALGKVKVVAALRDGEKSLAQAEAWAGKDVPATRLLRITNAEELARFVAEGSAAATTLDPGESQPFLAVMADVPASLGQLQLHLEPQPAGG